MTLIIAVLLFLGGAMLLGLAIHNTFSQAWQVLVS